MNILRTILSIIPAILAFGLLIFIHELGHFLAAKWSGIKVNEFAIGMGPTLFRFGKGETTYALRLLPIGGFVAMEGEDGGSEDSRSFSSVALPKRMLTVVAGAVMNLVLGFLIILVMMSFAAGFKVPQIKQIDPNLAAAASLQADDIIIRVNGKKVQTFNDMTFQFSRDSDGVVDLEVRRGDEIIALSGVEFPMATQEGISYINIGDGFVFHYEEATPGRVFLSSLDTTKSVAKQIWASLFDLLTRKVEVNQLSGPVGITKEIGSYTSQGDWRTVALFVAMISINLGIFNLLPFPALDGGRLLILLIEAIRRKPLPAKFEIVFNATGMVLLLGLMLVVTFNDIIKLF